MLLQSSPICLTHMQNIHFMWMLLVHNRLSFKLCTAFMCLVLRQLFALCHRGKAELLLPLKPILDSSANFTSKSPSLMLCTVSATRNHANELQSCSIKLNPYCDLKVNSCLQPPKALFWSKASKTYGWK